MSLLRLKSVSISLLMIAIAGCASNPELKMTEQQREERRLQTLNVYEDNRVGISESDASGRRQVVINQDPDIVTGVSVAGKAFNLLDVRKMTSRKGEGFTVELNNGETYTGHTVFVNKAKRIIDSDSPALISCTKDKKCAYRWQSLNGGNGAGGGLVGFYPDQKPSQITDFNPYPGFYLMEQYGNYSLYVMSKEESIMLLNERKIAFETNQKNERLARERALQAEADRVARNAAETKKVRSSIKTGTRTNCGVVISVNKPLALIETSIGQKYIEINSLYGPGDTCRFINGQYAGR